MNYISKSIKKKQERVREVTDFIEKSESVIIVGYKFSTVEKIFELRKILKNIKSSFFKVCTNNVIRRSFKEKKIVFGDDTLSEMNGLVFLKDTMSGLKALANFCKENEELKIKTGVINNEICDYNHIMELALMPSKEESIAKIISILKRPALYLYYILDKIKKENQK